MTEEIAEEHIDTNQADNESVPEESSENGTTFKGIKMQYGAYEFLYRTKGSSTSIIWREYKETDKKKTQIDHFIAAKVEVVAMVRDIEHTGYGRLIKFIDQDGNERTYTLRFADISRDSESIISRLRDRGLFITSSGNSRKLIDFIHNAKVDRKIRTTDLAGWHEGNVFVLPGRTLGTTGEELIFSNDNLKLKPFLSSGTLEDWKQNVAKYCVGNPVPTFAVSISFAAPLLHLIHMENGGFNMMGDSSIGKSTGQAVATSVFGNPKDVIQKWNMTINSLEGVAKAFNDFMLPLDEIGQSTANQIGEIVYMLGSGSGKGRANIHGEARKRAQFRTLFLSNGEKTLEEHMSEASKKVKAGQEVRLVDIVADMGAGYGIYNDIHGHKSSYDFNEFLLENLQQYYGSAMIAYLEKLVALPDLAINRIQELIVSFVNESVPDNADGQVKRIAGRFALVACGGELATELGVTGWEPGTANSAARFLFDRWLSDRGNAGKSEDQKLLAQVRRFFELHGESRFASMDPNDDTYKIINRVGFRYFHYVTRENPETGVQEPILQYAYYVMSEGFKEICIGFNSKRASRILIDNGIIMANKDGLAMHSKRLPGFMHPKKVYIFGPGIIEDFVMPAATPAEQVPGAGTAETKAQEA